MTVIKPLVFVSYSRKNEDHVRKVRADLLNSQLECWMDIADIQTGERLNPVIENAISQSSLFFAYVTKDYLESRWCMQEIQYALQAPGVAVAPYVDSQATLDVVPSALLDEVAFGFLGPDNYICSVLELAGRAWASLQALERVVPSADHILAGPAIFDSAGYSRSELMERTKEELILAGPNLRSWMVSSRKSCGCGRVGWRCWMGCDTLRGVRDPGLTGVFAVLRGGCGWRGHGGGC